MEWCCEEENMSRLEFLHFAFYIQFVIELPGELHRLEMLITCCAFTAWNVFFSRVPYWKNPTARQNLIGAFKFKCFIPSSKISYNSDQLISAKPIHSSNPNNIQLNKSECSIYHDFVSGFSWSQQQPNLERLLQNSHRAWIVLNCVLFVVGQIEMSKFAFRESTNMLWMKIRITIPSLESIGRLKSKKRNRQWYRHKTHK